MGYGMNVFVEAEDIANEASTDAMFFLYLMGEFSEKAHYDKEWRKKVIDGYVTSPLCRSDFGTRIPKYLRALAADLEVLNPHKVEDI